MFGDQPHASCVVSIDAVDTGSRVELIHRPACVETCLTGLVAPRQRVERVECLTRRDVRRDLMRPDGRVGADGDRQHRRDNLGAGPGGHERAGEDAVGESSISRAEAFDGPRTIGEGLRGRADVVELGLVDVVEGREQPG